ncbi:MAG: ABC transporter permease subunit [Phycisphaera sp.]|nr:ABC transporter permease subunit [Phycisphaera sp.]
MSQIANIPEQGTGQRRLGFGLSAAKVGGAVLALMVLLCIGSLPWTLGPSNPDDAESSPRYDAQQLPAKLLRPGESKSVGEGDEAVVYDGGLMGTDRLGRSMLIRCLLGGSISLGIGIAAATITMIIGTSWGMIAGYAGGRIDSAMMRVVDVLYGLPYILLVVLLSVAFEPMMSKVIGSTAGNVVTLLLAIGAVSWLTLARVVRGQVLSLKGQPFIEAARATGCSTPRILLRHILPNLIGPIIVYTTLTVPQAILQESFLSFLGIGVQPPLPSWGNLASDGLTELNPVKSHLWLLGWPCLLLGATLLALNFMGDGLRDRYDPRAKKR